MAIRGASAELHTAGRFTLIGVAATLIHASVVWGLIVAWNVNPLAANLVAFLCAFGFSFAGQYLWTFRSTRRWRSALARFFAVSLSAFVVNNFVLIALLDLELVRSSVAALIAVCVIPLITYLFGRFWAFG